MTRIIKTTCIFIFTWAMVLSSGAQIKMNYHFGFIGITGDTTAKLGDPVLVRYNSCFDITNGVPKFTFPKSGVFAISCFEATPKITLLVHVYPNPFVNELNIRSLVNFPEKKTAKYTLVIADFTGKVIRQVKTDLASINAGFTIRANDLPMGYFIVTLYSEKELIQSFKILKAAQNG